MSLMPPIGNVRLSKNFNTIAPRDGDGSPRIDDPAARNLDCHTIHRIFQQLVEATNGASHLQSAPNFSSEPKT